MIEVNSFIILRVKMAFPIYAYQINKRNKKWAFTSLRYVLEFPSQIGEAHAKLFV